MAVSPLSFKLTADLSGFTASLNNALGQMRGMGQQVAQTFSGVSQQTTSATTSVSNGVGALMTRLGGLAAVYGAVRSVQTFAHMADEAALATARIQGLTGSTEQTREAQAALFEMSQRLQSGYGEAVASFSRMLPAVKELGGGVAETTRLTEILLTTAKLSGASATEAANSAMQFAQALGSGTLQGDELRSILENNNTLARTLAEGLGVTIGELRKMGEQGKLTSDLVANTLIGSYDAIKSKAAELPATVGGAWTQINNAFTKFVSDVSTSSGIFTDLASLMTEVAKAIGAVGKALADAGTESKKIGQERGAITFAQGIGLAFVYLADVIGSAVSAIYNNVAGIGNALRVVSLQAGAAMSFIAGRFDAAKSQFSQAGQAANDMADRFTKSRDAALGLIDAVSGGGPAMKNFIEQMMGPAVTLTPPGGSGSGLSGGGGGGGSTSKGDKATARGMESDVDAINASIEAERRRFAIAQEVSQIRSQMDRDRALAAIDAEQRVSRFQLDNQQITQEQYLAAEAVFEERKYEIRRAAVERQLQLAMAEGRDPAAVEAINAQLLALELDYQTRKQEIALQVQQASQGSGVGGIGQNLYATMQQSMNAALDGMLTKGKSFGQAMAGIWGSMRQAIIGEISKIIMAQIAGAAKERALALVGISANAAKAGSGAFAAMASIPYVGPILGAAAMIAAVAAVMALGGGIKSASGGFDIPAGLNPITQLHAEEMVLPAEQANAVRAMTQGGQAGSVQVTVQGASAGDFFLMHKSELVKALQSARRDLAF